MILIRMEQHASDCNFLSATKQTIVANDKGACLHISNDLVHTGWF